MNKRATALLSALLVLLPLAAGAAAPATDRIIVKWRNPEAASAPVSEARLQKVATRTRRLLQPGRTLGGALSVVQLSRTEHGADLDATLAALRADPDVELAVPDGRVKIQAVTPSDPLFSDVLAYQGVNYDRQWYLKSVQPAAIRADAAWEITRGGTSAATSTVVVAVLDTGVRLGHPDLAGKLLQGFDFVSNTAIANDGNGWDNDPSDPGDFLTADDLTRSPFKDGECGTPSNSSWHGTRVSGLIAADTDNGIGMAGTGFHIRILPVRVLGKCGGYDSDVIAGMYWAAGLAPPPPYIPAGQTIPPVNPTPAQVLNMSLGGADPCTTQNAAVYRAAVNDIVAHGVVIVASAGNDGKAVGTPGSCVGVLGVAGVRHAGTKVGYSNLGPEVGIAAPAGNCVFVNAGDPCVYALNSTSNSGTQTPGTDVYTSPTVQPSYGTSFSTPLVAGTAGLMKAVNPTLTPAKLIQRLKATARPFPAVSDTQPQPPACVLPSVNALQAAECICNTQVCGAGLLDAEAAVRAALSPVAVAQVTGNVVAGRAATLDGSGSAASAGRSIARYQWSVVTAPGSSPPVIQSASQAIASVTAPSSGTLLLRLTLTDNLGATDTAEVSITGSGDTSSSSPPPTSGGGGGGRLDLLLLTLTLALWLQRRHHPHRRAAH